LGVVLSFGSNQTAFIGVDYANKKGGYLLSRIALFDTVYHRTNWGVEGKQKKRPFDCSNERFVRKKTATYSPALPYLTRCTIGA